MRAVHPSVAVFSVQRDGRFGHPHPVVVERYRSLDAAMFRTDEHGAITVRTDGQSVWVIPYLGEPALIPTPVAHRLAETRARPPVPPR